MPSAKSSPFYAKINQSCSDVLLTHNSSVRVALLPDCLESPIVYNISTASPIFPATHIANSKYLTMRVVGLSYGTIAEYPLFLSEGSILTLSLTNTTKVRVEVAADYVFNTLATDQVIEILDLPVTLVSGDNLEAIWSAPKLKGVTQVDSAFNDTLVEWSSLDESYYTKQRLAGTDLTYNLNYQIRRSDMAWQFVIERARRNFEPVYVVISQGDSNFKGSPWFYGRVYFTSPTRQATVRNIVTGSCGIVSYDGGFKWGSNTDVLTNAQLADYNQVFDRAGLLSQGESIVDLDIQLAANSVIGDSRVLYLNGVTTLTGAVSWAATPNIGTFSNPNSLATSYTIVNPIHDQVPVNFTLTIGSASTTEQINIAQWRSETVFSYSANSTQSWSTDAYDINDQGDSVIAYIDKGSSLTLQISQTNMNAGDVISVYDGVNNYGIIGNDLALYTSSLTTATLVVPSGKAIIWVTTNAAGLTPQINFTMI